MRNYKLLNFKVNGNEMGKLVAIEGLNQIPFEIKRIFYIYGVKGDAVRGRHSNRNSEFVMINVKGSADVRLHDGSKEHVVNLSKPNEGLYIPKLMWKDMYNFSDDCGSCLNPTLECHLWPLLREDHHTNLYHKVQSSLPQNTLEGSQKQ